MAAVMYGAMTDGALVEMRETLFKNELDLQDFLSNHPALLAGDQMNALDPRRFVLITPEAGIKISESGADYFSLDHLFIDQDGIPTLVEVKRSTDTRLRREVVGQMLEYAANACAFWDAGRLRAVFESRCEKAGVLPEDELSKIGSDAASDPDALWQKVGQNLSQERLRLVFLADKFLPETQRIIEFLNRQVQSTEVYAVEVRQYTGGGLKTLVPRVLNPSVLQTDRRASMSAGRGEMWTQDRFYADLEERCGREAVTVYRDIQQWVAAQPQLAVYYGRGKSDGSLQITYKTGEKPTYESGKDIVMVSLWTYGRIEIEFAYMMLHAPFQDSEKRRELWQRLSTGSTLAIPEARIDLRPSIEWTTLADSNNMRVFLAAMDWAVSEISANANTG